LTLFRSECLRDLSASLFNNPYIRALSPFIPPYISTKLPVVGKPPNLIPTKIIDLQYLRFNLCQHYELQDGLAFNQVTLKYKQLTN